MENDITDIPPIPTEETETTHIPPLNNKKERILTVRLDDEEWKQIQILKSKPYYINIAHFLRDSLKHLYESRTNKAGRTK